MYIEIGFINSLLTSLMVEDLILAGSLFFLLEHEQPGKNRKTKNKKIKTILLKEEVNRYHPHLQNKNNPDILIFLKEILDIL